VEFIFVRRDTTEYSIGTKLETMVEQ